MNIINENDLLETSDLSLVATLLTQGAKIMHVGRNGGLRATFYFRKQEGIEGLVDAFYGHSLLVDPMRYFSALKEAKSRLYSAPIDYGD